MTIATRSPDLRPKAPRFILLAILCAVAVAGLTQCKITPDKVTGVTMEMDRNKQERGGKCVSKCSKKADKALDKEDDLYERNKKACHKDAACLAAEKARHKAAVEQIQEDRRHCVDGCHHQGGGHGR